MQEIQGLKKRGYLTPAQLKAIELIFQSTFESPETPPDFEQIAKECGVNLATVYRWHKSPVFVRLLNRTIFQGRLLMIPDVMRAFKRHFKEPLANPKVMQLYLENAGLHVKREIRANVDVMIDAREGLETKATEVVIDTAVYNLYRAGINDGAAFEARLKRAKVRFEQANDDTTEEDEDEYEEAEDIFEFDSDNDKSGHGETDDMSRTDTTDIRSEPENDTESKK